MLKMTPFFSAWSLISISRLYFWLERRKFGSEEDVVRQGEDAVRIYQRCAHQPRSRAAGLIARSDRTLAHGH